MILKIVLLILLFIHTDYYFFNKKMLAYSMDDKYETVTLGGGCFWCTEAIFQRIKGVVKILSGYSGGSLPNPTYEAVSTGKTGHAEVIQITYDTSVITFEEILEIFFSIHDPTTLNRQGADIGSQYRSVIFYHNEKQKRIAEALIKKLDSEKIWDNPIVTEVCKFQSFYEAEDYHQNYYNNNPYKPYCTFVIAPKIEKLRKYFSTKLK